MTVGRTTGYYPRGHVAAYDTSVEITADGSADTVSYASYIPTSGALTLTVAAH